MSVRVTPNPEVGRITRTAASSALRTMSEDIVTFSTPRTPKRQGFLRRNVIKQVLGLHATIRWAVDYAEIQERRRFRHYTTPGTGPGFAEYGVSQVVNRASEYFRKAGLL